MCVCVSLSLYLSLSLCVCVLRAHVSVCVSLCVSGVQAACDANPKCHAWTLVPKVKCCLKGSVPVAHKTAHSATYTSGVKDPKNFPTPGKTGRIFCYSDGMVMSR